VTEQPPKAVLLDLDGTVISGERLIDGAAAGVDRLRAAGLPVLFFTNRATHAPTAHAATLQEGGIDATAEDVLTSAAITAEALGPADGPAIVLGGDPLRAALTDAGVEVLTDSNPAAVRTVVASVSPDLDFERLTAATRAIAQGAQFVATNPDGARPTPRGPLPETGAVSAALTAATGTTPTVFGKPHPGAAEVAVERLCHANDTVTATLNPAECLLVGDTPATDVALGRAVGATTVLLSDNASNTPQNGDQTPDFRLESLADIPTVLEAVGCA
jgi:4-nitrophenyl phosphatase